MQNRVKLKGKQSRSVSRFIAEIDPCSRAASYTEIARSKYYLVHYFRRCVNSVSVIFIKQKCIARDIDCPRKKRARKNFYRLSLSLSFSFSLARVHNRFFLSSVIVALHLNTEMSRQ